ncbi:MAG: hypothetical protein ACI8ZM_001062 [Crocinitomix sp.]|jgi:hypothetical protein
MIKLPITLFIGVIPFLSLAADLRTEGEVAYDTIEIFDNNNNSSELFSVAQTKTPTEILIGGSWNNPDAIRSEDVIFNTGGKMLWRSGTDEGEGTWEVKGSDVLHFYGKDYKIEELTESKLVVSDNGEKTTYERNNESDCDPQFKVEGINDAKGQYINGNESWTIHFSEDKFIAFYTKDGDQDDVIVIKEIVSISKCEYSIMMDGMQSEFVSQWTLVYNETEKFYDLHVHSYDAATDTWSDKIFEGSNDNG